MSISFGEEKDHSYFDFVSVYDDTRLLLSGDASDGDDELLISGDEQETGTDLLVVSSTGSFRDLNYFESFFDTGYMTRGEGHKKFTEHYTTVYSRAAEDYVTDSSGALVLTENEEKITDSIESSCLLTGKWDWANDVLSNMWTTEQQVYDSEDRPYRSTQKRKLKLRGTGKTLQLSFNSEEGKPFHIIGWSTFDAVNQKV